jgi:glyceraldehyde-3-phosphate dehydrogenase (NADP+)
MERGAVDIADKIASLFPTPDDIPPAVRLETPLRQDVYLINGELRRWTGPVQEIFSPVCIRTAAGLSPYLLGSYPLLSENEALAALHAAEQAYGQGRGRWPTMSVGDRIKHLEDFAYRMREKRAEVVSLLMWEIGKSLLDAQKEFDRTVDYIKDTIEAVKDLDRASSRFTVVEGVIAQIRRGPLGVVLCMGPFNYPLNETFTTLIPALIMGNAVIFKPPRLGVLLHRPLLEAFRDAFPPGVVNTVYGDGAKVIGPLMHSGRINVLAFIGSSQVTDLLRQQHPRPHRLRCVLGLEAKNAGIILPDADLDATVTECLTGTLSYNGQRCTALKMLFVHEKIADEFLRRFTAAMEALVPGMPWDAQVQLTPLPEREKTTYLTDLVADAHRFGAATVNPSGGLVNQTFFLSRGGVPRGRADAPVSRGAVRARHSRGAVYRPGNPHPLPAGIRLRTASEYIRPRPGHDRPTHRPFRQPSVPRQHQQPMPTGPGRLSLRRQKRLGRGDSFRVGRAAGLFHSHPRRRQSGGVEQGDHQHHRARTKI